MKCCNLFSQGIEQQRKYVVPKEISKAEFLAATQSISDLSVHYHSSYIYYDLYLETPDMLLYKNGFGLRFRKRIISDSLSSYSMQLKNEMTEISDSRMEIEESELDFYKVKVNDTFVDLTKVLDSVFLLYKSIDSDQKRLIFERNIKLIQEWITMKVDSPIAPFQQLKYSDSIVFNSESLKNIKPFICCESRRERGHVYIDPKTNNSDHKILPLNKVKLSDRPDFFKEHPTLNWIMEVSFDSTESIVIYGDFIGRKINISEYEVENKYANKEIGTKLMNYFESFLIKELKVYKEYNSKYKQIVNNLLL